MRSLRNKAFLFVFETVIKKKYDFELLFFESKAEISFQQLEHFYNVHTIISQSIDESLNFFIELKFMFFFSFFRL